MSRKTTATSFVLAALMSTAAAAQQTPTPPEQPAPSAVSKPSAGPAVKPTEGSDVAIIAQQRPNETLASEIKGLPVKNTSDESLGTVSDIVMGADDKVTAILVRVGGFLGLGASDVAVSRESLKLTTDKDGNKIAKVETTREAFEKAPRYVTVKGQSEADRTRQPSATSPRNAAKPGSATPPDSANRNN